VSIGVPVPSGRGRLRRSGPPRPGTDRPAAHGKADAGLDKPTPAPKSQIVQDRHLRSQRTAQAEAAWALSVVVRSEPVLTAVNSNLAARRARMTWCTLAPSALQEPQGEARRRRPTASWASREAARQLRTYVSVVCELCSARGETTLTSALARDWLERIAAARNANAADAHLV